MHVILGGTGHIGSALGEQLLARGEAVTIVSRSERKRARWERRGARFAVVDARDVTALRRTLATAHSAFVLNPPADPAGDSEREERATAAAIVAAVESAGLARVVVQSTYGAQRGTGIGDLGVLYELEQALLASGIPEVAVVRGAYYMSNWDMAIDGARRDGKLFTLLPGALRMPMVAAHDLATVAAELLTGAIPARSLHHVEAPARYCADDVARTLANVLGTPVDAASVAPPFWERTLAQLGFSAEAATSMAGMTRTVLAQGPELPEMYTRGTTTLESYLRSAALSNRER